MRLERLTAHYFSARVLFLFLAICIGELFVATTRADEKIESAGAFELKAAFLYNFAKFVEWPPQAFKDSSDDFRLGVIGDDAFGSVVEEVVRGKTVKGRSIKFTMYNKIEEIEMCHLLFISSSKKKRLVDILGGTKGKSILTVSEIDGFGHMGGIVNFVMKEDKLKFEINPGAAEKAKLKVSSQLLNLARIVKTKHREEN